MSRFDKEYQQMINLNTLDDSHWTQFELDLIACIRDEYPIIYSNDDGLNGYQRAGKIRTVWKEISKKFQDLTKEQLREKWKDILDKYFKVKIYDVVDKEGTTELTKYLDGTLSFLENVRPELLRISTFVKNTSSGTNESFEKDNDESYSLKLRDILHEEIDLDDDVSIKEEGEDTATNADPINKQKWTEEELMNATRLSKEMIDELILIKKRKYYLSPAKADK